MDPAGLRAAGCPRGEYRDEVIDILCAFGRTADTNPVRAFIEVEVPPKFGAGVVRPDVARRVAARCVAEVAGLRGCPRPML